MSHYERKVRPMIFLVTLGLIFLALVVTSQLIKLRKANNIIEGAKHELDRARKERAADSSGQFASNHDWPSYRGHDNYGITRS